MSPAPGPPRNLLLLVVVYASIDGATATTPKIDLSLINAAPTPEPITAAPTVPMIMPVPTAICGPNNPPITVAKPAKEGGGGERENEEDEHWKIVKTIFMLSTYFFNNRTTTSYPKTYLLM